MVKTLFRLVGAALMLSGWIIAALCIYVVRTPNPKNPAESCLVVVPKYRLGLRDTYVDARKWTMADVHEHPMLVLRLIDADQANQLKFLADPKSKQNVESQLTDALSDASPSTTPSADHKSSPSRLPRSRTSIRPGGLPS